MQIVHTIKIQTTDYTGLKKKIYTMRKAWFKMYCIVMYKYETVILFYIIKIWILRLIKTEEY